MKKMQIFEPAMCCPTGICGVGVDPELLRISTVLHSLKNQGIEVERFNLSNAPQQFVTNQVVNTFINEKGVEGLPITVLDGAIVLAGRYPNNEEFIQFLDIPARVLAQQPKAVKRSVSSSRLTVKSSNVKKSGGCGCSGGDCC